MDFTHKLQKALDRKHLYFISLFHEISSYELRLNFHITYQVYVHVFIGQFKMTQY